MTANETIIVAEPGKQEMLIIREFDAPRELVFRAFTDPKLYVQWLGPRGGIMTLDIFEPKTNGKWRYLHTDPNGTVTAFHGVYHEVLSPELVINTFEFEGLPEKGHVCLETVRFEELPGERTRLTAHSIFQSVADRDSMLQSGMEEGTSASFERLAELLKKMER
ncbi:SRPBCC family protein [Tengunoibacter tsumagoiensis]|uniref:ATPase n=1 Tax=Tengunoibacter tsumagoiensis TaxID=2014871 RepID=A0A401ZZM3_9CHLR|nr:SRPBCC family protein [Tengunoibacter tsumagoiensis]GCE12318.1 ATPase [Tengunoibacter tsumagoiensis]